MVRARTGAARTECAPAFRVHGHANAGMFAAHAVHVLRKEALVHGAVPGPQDDARVLQLLQRPAAGRRDCKGYMRQALKSS